ncbi:TonB-dependent receptor [Brevundimonas sp. PAMC22021]|uniref:TonB-dependent receptor n=1 Tax=Brevundimonas sp. PAMC22021 TaxID=2861285 RepID=UPI001C625768|nr:TonB-dependent receptor [Brevundimonas sp. PAMC22021]QYF87105.1 TonB-dependent receptor [Brevundimonas sp. PAMC22021]
MRLSKSEALRATASSMALGAALLLALPAAAQDAEPTQEVDEIVVTGIRASLASALNEKRRSNTIVDVINAEDIADFPDANLAESLQRIPGVSIDRENGEGNSISVRGLGGDFTRVRLNGLETLSTSGANNADGALRRDRGFQFNTFASELFNSLKVQKSADAKTDEGSLGATVDLISGRPFDFNEGRVALTLQDAYYENGGTHNPRLALLASERWSSRIGEFGLLGSVAYNEREQNIDSYSRSTGSNEYVYRGATFNNVGANAAGDHQGFALPIGTPLSALPRVSNPEARSYLIGSDPEAYALLNGGSTRGSLVHIPSLATLNHREVEQERLGVTLSGQWRPTARTVINFDNLYSEQTQVSTNYQIGAVGLNRNNTNGNRTLTSFSYQTFPTTSASNNSYANRRGSYANCATQAATEFRDAIDCGQSLYGNTPIFRTAPGATNQNLAAGTGSFNPNNLEVYDYYNQPGSVGYIFHPQALALRGAFIGRPSVRLIDAGLSETGANANYLVLGNVDMRSAVDQGGYTTEFRQNSINIEHDWSDTFRMSLLVGDSESSNTNTGLLADFIRLDSGQGVAGDDYFVFDDREGGDMPIMNFGFDVADPDSWDFVKGYSALRHFRTITENGYKTAKIDFEWDLDEDLTFSFGIAQRKFDFYYTRFERLIGDTMNPSLLEGVRTGLVDATTVADMGQLTTWGEGLDVPGGTPTSFFTPNLQAFQTRFGFDCDCINDFGDWRLSDLRNGGVNTFSVDEDSLSYYGQLDFRVPLFIGDLRGNAGLRRAETKVDSRGRSPSGRPVQNDNEYNDTLPSLNLVWELNDKLILRFATAKVMARPQMTALQPGITAFNVPVGIGADPAQFDGSNAAITLGNTKLKPFRATNFDFNAEWYFARDAILSFAYFHKEIESFPQVVLREGRLSEIFDAEQIANLRLAFDGLTDVASDSRRAYIDQDLPFQVRQFNDAPGGTLSGVEIAYQQNFTFLPGLLQNFGVQANYTHIESELEYILDPARNLTGTAPFLGASPDAFNATLFYEVPRWSARVSTAYRAEYQTTYPLASGGCDPGQCDSPLINDFAGSAETLNVDASFTYKLSDAITLTAEALNLTDQKDERWSYQDDPVVANYASTGRQYFVGARFTF